MKKFLIAASAAAALGVAAVPASAQVFVGADPGGVGVEVGPLGVEVGPRHGWRHHRHYTDGYYAYGSSCRTIRERIVTDYGRVIYRTRRICD